ncbi:hypothetical protein ACLB1G_26095 [Oxalobacteraceae bacterium A2-2]
MTDVPAAGTRVLRLAFRRRSEAEEGAHWEQLCEVANALQHELGWPAPAVSIDGASSYGLWLSLAEPLAAPQADELARLLRQCYGVDVDMPAADQLPPRLHPSTGLWAAFIHPGMGASFADVAGLDMEPPEAGQLGFLEGLDSITAAQLAQALNQLRPQAAAPAPLAAVAAVAPDGLLLKDATLEDIIRHLHSRNIEPTFRHLLPK